jgi:hypothetical protein
LALLALTRTPKESKAFSTLALSTPKLATQLIKLSLVLWTDSSHAGTQGRMLKVVDFLIKKESKLE